MRDLHSSVNQKTQKSCRMKIDLAHLRAESVAHSAALWLETSFLSSTAIRLSNPRKPTYQVPLLFSDHSSGREVGYRPVATGRFTLVRCPVCRSQRFSSAACSRCIAQLFVLRRAQKELDLLKLATCIMAEPRTGAAEVVRGKMRKIHTCGCLLDNVPNRFL
jgi:hypothetical protein